MSEFQTVLRDATVAGAEAVITTEKDAVKLPEVAAILPVHVVRVKMRIEDEPAFTAAILAGLSTAFQLQADRYS